ncbi:MAG TPA: hypothetical protein VHX14_12065 [Thermoanaerobaculia bacterium]|nr:hypothetical protein [Thermoanaerobaculia bacterium]
MKRMNVVIDREALELARRITGKKSYSETINHAIAQIVKQEKLMEAIDALAKDPDPWWPGYVEEMAPDVAEYLRKIKKPGRHAAQTVRAPRPKRESSRGSR